ncbi:unnamed protein product [Cuscuta campestris]|uniref:Uncharacterized protein n=1 Tax=Cuscuta campestris TaxID=132261 RepID=A0A484N9J5_9ASTE|nr:unnamed protein product [Cuscuta campestris]
MMHLNRTKGFNQNRNRTYKDGMEEKTSFVKRLRSVFPEGNEEPKPPWLQQPGPIPGRPAKIRMGSNIYLKFQ